jgi:uncharacterized protein
MRALPYRSTGGPADAATMPDPPHGSTAAYIVPFLAYIGLMGVERVVPLPIEVAYPVRCAVSAALLLLLSRPVLSFRPSRFLASAAIGAAVFLIWIAPDRLFAYRHFWLFENPVLGTAASSLSPALRANLPFLAIRALGSTLLVPILEELFWRGWLMRWFIDAHFLKVPLGTYTPISFWMVAVLFGSEHGPYWEVGLAAGILYNWWMIRTRNLADCILAHSLTNGLLSAYILAAGQWQYWL